MDCCCHWLNNKVLHTSFKQHMLAFASSLFTDCYSTLGNPSADCCSLLIVFCSVAKICKNCKFVVNEVCPSVQGCWSPA